MPSHVTNMVNMRHRDLLFGWQCIVSAIISVLHYIHNHYGEQS